MKTLANGISYIDLQFLGHPRTIASVILSDASGVVIVDPGPSTTLPALERALDSAGIALRDVTGVLLTHIHLDHAGATGTLLSRNPAIRVLVHEKGAPHLVDPAKLLSSAQRLYGDQMETLWGEVRRVPASAIVALAGGERVTAGGRTWDVMYTPGHASHHVSYFSRDAGVALVGDTAGVKILPDGPIIPPTPPPDIDIESWRASLQKINDWNPATLFLTHFGPYGASGAHLAEVREQLEKAATLVRASLARDESDEARSARFTEEMRLDLRRRLPEADAQAYDVAARFDLCWSGLARYWRKKSG